MNTSTIYTPLQQELYIAGVQLIAVSKTKPAEMIQEIYDAGQRAFGENRAQEMAGKHENLPQDIKWHMIGRLQTNKVKYIASFVHMIHSVDSLKLLKEIDRQASKHSRIIPCLLQIHIAREETKTGFVQTDLDEMLRSPDFKNLSNIQISGLMGMATFTDDAHQIRSEFKELASLFRSVKEKYFNEDLAFKEISMGMTSDYTIAVDEGSTMVRVGSLIFGERG